ncbi:NAD-dependent protein deacetylase [Marilutibacter chinensis]|uniref:protein acetyllysine N-acetyltransferase n=1 Tax=Marilutibacter chinensis TaxID=2912247 RepID=A0ABS9HNR5_9GAMM|nr:NAD-dependent protein deacetylase [Lysobacter chinensis]MCF7220634.1 NAD-dependent protein deacetylase [Lysobacter chinensis]
MTAALPVDAVDACDALADWLRRYRHVFVLTGAGCSTASGIPDYRGSDGNWKRSAPITWQAFSGDPLARARYWARSQVGWPRVAAAGPNPAHLALTRLQALERIERLVTQNVDGLHERAGSRDVIDLHGRIDMTVCLGCGLRMPRAGIQTMLETANPEWTGLDAGSAPDGDADLEGRDFSHYRVPDCDACGGLIKPDVVFFGENVPRARVDAAHAALARADAMLVVGSSLMVYSGYRFARLARGHGLPLAILTHGVNRADPLATLKLEADASTVLPAAVAQMER